MDPLLHKRHGFAAERELRLLKFDLVHYGALVPKDASVPELPDHIYVDWVLRDVIDEIVISPYAGENYEELVRLAINAADPKLNDRVVLSVLSERRNPAISSACRLGHAEIELLNGRDPGVRGDHRHRLRAALGRGHERARIGRNMPVRQ
ncbi:MAG: hypothetical protein WAK54_02125 [Bradyrhizobium sp.]